MIYQIAISENAASGISRVQFWQSSDLGALPEIGTTIQASKGKDTIDVTIVGIETSKYGASTIIKASRPKVEAASKRNLRKKNAK